LFLAVAPERLNRQALTEWVREQIKPLEMRLAAPFRGVLSGAGGGGLPCAMPLLTFPRPWDVSGRKFISQLRGQHARPSVVSVSACTALRIIRLLGAWHSNIEQRWDCWGLRRALPPPARFYGPSAVPERSAPATVDWCRNKALRQELRPAVERMPSPSDAIRNVTGCRTRDLASPSRSHGRSQCLGFATR